MKSVCIGLPCYTGRISLDTFFALQAARDALIKDGWRVETQAISDVATISTVRDTLVAGFLKTDCSDMIMIDDDLTFPPDALQRLLAHDVDLVGGVYPFKSEAGGFAYGRLDDSLTPACCEWPPFLPVSCAFPAFVAEDMTAAYREDGEYKVDSSSESFVGLFTQQSRDMPDGTRRLFSEDYSFCLRWGDLGGEVYADASIEFGHIGRKEFRRGSLAAHLAGDGFAKPMMNRQQRRAAARRAA